MIRGLDNLSYDEKLKEFGIFTLEKRRLKHDLITLFQYLKYTPCTGYKLPFDKETYGENNGQEIQVALKYFLLIQ